MPPAENEGQEIDVVERESEATAGSGGASGSVSDGDVSGDAEAASTEPATGSAGDSDGNGAETPPPRPADSWKDREIAKLRARNRELSAQLQRPVGDTPSSPQLDPVADFNRRVEEAAAVRAAQIAQVTEFNRRCDEVATAGRKAYGDFDQRVAAINGTVDKTDPQQAEQFNQFLMAVVETGEGARLIHELGGDLNETTRIMALPPVRMAIELAKMAAREPSEVSRAPRPITPITNSSTNRSPINPDDPDRADQLSTAEWIRRRNAQINERRAR